MMKTVANILRALRAPSIEEIEAAYLNGASTRYDLEQRQREVDHGVFRRRFAAYY